MKKLLHIFIVFLSLTFCSAQLSPDLTPIISALQEGNAVALGKFFDESVEIGIMDKEEIYNKGQAIQVVKNFFSTNKPTSFKMVHHGSANNKGSDYTIGELKAGAKNYRVYMFMKQAADAPLIQELRFEEAR